MKGILERLVRERGFWWYGICQFLSVVFFGGLFRYRAFGRGHVPSEGGVVLASNHQSYFDPVLVGLSLGRQIHIMAREGLFSVPGFSALIRSLNAFPVRRGAFDREALRQALKLLGEGKVLVVFPEGTRTRDGRLLKPKAGIGLMARKAGVPVVPVLIRGAFEAWPANRALFRAFVPIRVDFGPPVRAETSGRYGVEGEVERFWASMAEAEETS